ncbi:hypothetical protein S245_017946, partial [Arachis hypogaea]
LPLLLFIAISVLPFLFHNCNRHSLYSSSVLARHYLLPVPSYIANTKIPQPEGPEVQPQPQPNPQLGYSVTGDVDQRKGAAVEHSLGARVEEDDILVIPNLKKKKVGSNPGQLLSVMENHFD